MASQPHTTISSIGLLVLRVGMGAYIALAHGWGKVQMRLDNKGEGFPDPVGLGNEMSLTLAAMSEFGGGLLVLLGLATRFGAAAVVFTMGVAAFVFHADDPWTSSDGASKEMALLFFTGFLTLIFTGPGRFSLDALIQKRWRDRRNKG